MLRSSGTHYTGTAKYRYKKGDTNHILGYYLLKDPCFEVRQLFLNKLTALITSRKLPARFNVILFLTVHDPEDEIRDKVSFIISLLISLDHIDLIQRLDLLLSTN